MEVLRSYSEGAISKECSATVVPSSEDFALEDFSQIAREKVHDSAILSVSGV